MSEHESGKKFNASLAGRVEISRCRLLGFTFLIAASVVASAALPRPALSQDANVLPKPQPQFHGKIERTL